MWMSPFERTLRRIICLPMGALSFVYLICVINPAQMLSMVIYPFSKSAFRAFNTACANHIWGFWVWMAYRVAKIDFRFSGDALPPRENSIVVSNHQSMADILLLLCVAKRCQRLGHMKFFVKDVLRFVPGPGWGMVFLDCIFLKRNWTEDKAHIERLFSKFRSEDIPIFLVSFLEGTRFRPGKLAQAQAFAQQRGLAVPQHTLVPRTKGFVASVHGLHAHIDAVYDITLAYERRPVPSLLDCFALRVRTVDIHIRRTPVEALPVDDEAALSDWVFASYKEKDARLGHHYSGTQGEG